ncbi:MAG: hypothetical protein ACFFAH_01495 [Promethearchaeota archaeon]
MKRIGAKRIIPGNKIILIGGTHQKEEPHSIFSIQKALSRRKNRDFIIFLQKYGFQVVLFSYPQELMVENFSQKRQKETRREFKLKIIQQEGPSIILSVHNNHWAKSAEVYTLAGEYGDDGVLKIPGSEKISLNPAPLRFNSETQKWVKQHDPMLLIVNDGMNSEIDIGKALKDHSMIPTNIVNIKFMWWQDFELRNSFSLDLPYLGKDCFNQDAQELIEYGKKVLQDIIKCIIRHKLMLPQTTEKIMLISGKKKPLTWYTGKTYHKPPPLKMFR